MSSNTMKNFLDSSYLGSGNDSLEELYELYLQDATQLTNSWRKYFDELVASSSTDEKDQIHSSIRHKIIENSKYSTNIQRSFTQSSSAPNLKQNYVNKLVNDYRKNGHLYANLDPLKLQNYTDINYKNYNLSQTDLPNSFIIHNFENKGEFKLEQIITKFNGIYCNTTGFEYMHISNEEEVKWWQQQIEYSDENIDKDIKLKILNDLVAADSLEKHLQTKYVGQKRFSLEGGDSLIVALNALIDKSSSYGTKEIMISMAHRGRLNVLVNILGKSATELFKEFEGTARSVQGSGDVKYHLGFACNRKTSTGDVHLALAFNPSHLEIVAPVAQGSVRSMQDKIDDHAIDKVLPINIHGDAAIAGQGVVMETLNMCHLRSFSTGGTIHIVVNNQVGFTTSNHEDSRSTRYCTDIAKMVDSPVIHVNADDPEAVFKAALLAAEYRSLFHKDIFIDLICYRRHGHNEADEPSGTQPLMYQKIKKMSALKNKYAEILQQQNIIDDSLVNTMTSNYRDQLDRGDIVAPGFFESKSKPNLWKNYINSNNMQIDVDTSYDVNKLRNLANVIFNYDTSKVKIQTQVRKVYEQRQLMAQEKVNFDWGAAELLAYASLVEQNYNVRLTGQDSGRGTFAHRHAVLHNQLNGQSITPLHNVESTSTKFIVTDSFLSEAAVLGFEYGYSINNPNDLVIWEAQFGDFANNAQVVIDQFISSSEQKWQVLSSLTMLLPHGYEAMGPEHSSARLERFLQLCAQYNMIVCTPTTAAQMYHLLRRQMLASYRKPLIVMTPKEFLRHKSASSSMQELANGKFSLILPDNNNSIENENVDRMIICGGKIYYELEHERQQKQIKNLAIVRIEQLYPFPRDELLREINKYSNLKEIVWCQEEPNNQGAWLFLNPILYNMFNNTHKLLCVSRDASSAPAGGYRSDHFKQQKIIIDKALRIN